MRYDRKNDAPESFTAGSVGFVQKRSIPKVILGMLCRFAVAFTGAAGVCMMFDDALRFTGDFDPGKIMLVSLAFCSAWFLFFIASDLNGVFFGAVSAGYLSALIYGVVRIGPKAAFGFVPVSVWNHLLARLDSLGFTALSGLKVLAEECDPLTDQGAAYARIGFYAFCAVISFVFISCLYKKVKAVPVIVSAGIVMTVTFTYNLISENFGFLLTVASGFGMLVLLHYSAFTKQKSEDEQTDGEGYYKNRRRSLARASAPGLAAVLVTAIVLAVGAVPASRIKEPAPELTVLYDVIDDMRSFFSKYLVGETGPGDGYEADRKSTEPTPRNFKEKKLLSVSAEYPSPLYLRAWVSESYGGDKWTSAENSSANGIDILPEQITELFYTIIDVDANILTKTDGADITTLDRGFLKEFVVIRSEALNGKTGLLASRFSTLYGVMDTKMKEGYANEYRMRNGVGTVGMSMKGAEYGTVAYAPDYKYIKLEKLDGDMRIYNIVLPYIRAYAERRLGGETALDDWLDTVKKEVRRQAAEFDLTIPDGCLINYMASLSDEDLVSLKIRLDQVRAYEEHVYDNCTSVPWSDERTLSKAAESAFGGRTAAMPSEVYSIARRTARYLEDLCEYDLMPEGYTDRGSYIAQFLTSAKTGYCVQYASAGALMLRTAGIPTRYVDGYLASDFYIKNGKYVCDVLDSSSHAWVEAYVRGYGWMTFEMTEPMLDGIYGKPGEINTVTETDTETAETTDAEETTKDTETTPPVTRPLDSLTVPEDTTVTSDPVGDVISGRVLAAVGISLLCVLVISTLVYIYINTTSKRAKKRREMLERASKGESADPGNDINEISRYIFYMFGRTGLRREKTELMTDFVKRADEFTFSDQSFAAAARAIQKNAFGRCADKNDCKDAADYALYLRKITLNRLTLVKTIWYCEVLKRI